MTALTAQELTLVAIAAVVFVLWWCYHDED
jgi:hypothetical protein